MSEMVEIDPLIEQPIFGDLLRRHRLAAGLTQEELAERAGLSARGISDLERGARTNPQRETVKLLAEALALEPGERAAFVAAARRRQSASALATPSGSSERSADARFFGADLPIPTDPLLGREHDIAAVTALMREATGRLVSLTGPGGVGKTRLALQAATELRDAFPGGVRFVPLAAIRDPTLVLPAVAQAVGVRESAESLPEAGLVTVLRGRRALLVLDNLEQVLGAGPAVARLLAACPDLHALVTSRVALHLAGEQRYAVAPLAVPDAAAPPDSYDFASSPAIQLFVRRARQVRPDFALTPGTADAVAAICRRLDGLPLAIELAAARTAVLPPHALLSRLERALPLLAGGARDQPERLRTMRDAIAWSYDLLAPAAQALFRRLAVFEGGFTFEAAKAVHVAGCDEGDEWDPVFDGVAELVEASLLRSEDGPGGEPRFSMLETIREYGVERLAASGEEDAIRERHAAWVLAFVERAEPELFKAAQRTWGERLEAERPNIRAALTWFERTADAERAQRLAGILQTFGWLRGHLREGQDWLRRALAIQGESSAAARAWALLGRSTLAYFQGDYGSAWAAAEHALTIARDGSFPLGVAYAHHMLADIAREHDDLARAMAHGETAIAGLREVGHLRLLAISLADTGIIALLYGDRARGEAWSAEALTLCRTLGNHWFIANHLSDLGAVLHDRGDLKSAAQHYRESVRLFHEVDDTWFIASPLSGLAAIAVMYGHPDSAARLLGVATALREISGSAIWTIEQDRDEQTAAVVRAALGEEPFAEAVGIGRKLPLAQAVEEAMAITLDVDAAGVAAHR